MSKISKFEKEGWLYDNFCSDPSVSGRLLLSNLLVPEFGLASAGCDYFSIDRYFQVEEVRHFEQAYCFMDCVIRRRLT